MKRKLLISIFILASSLGWSQTVPPDYDIQDTLARATVTIQKERPRNTTQTGLMRLDTKELMRGAVSFGTPDIIRALLSLPGVAAGNELMSGMYVHGGDGTDNLFLLDGVPLYNISHFGGLFSSFNTDVTKGLDFYKSGFPARYGGRLSSVVDVETRDGDLQKYHGTVSLGLIDGRVQVEGPIIKGKNSFNIAYRRSWMDGMIWLAKKIKKVKDMDAAYFMHDFNAGFTHHFAQDNTLRINFFTGKDDMDMGLRRDNTDLDLDVKWGNLVGSAAWTYKIMPGLNSNLLAYYSQSRANTDYGIRMSKNKLEDTINSHIGDAGVKYGLDWFPNADHHIRTGVNLAAKMYRYKGQAPDTTSVAPKISSDAFEGSLYIEDEYFITRNFTLNAGLHYSIYSSTRKTWHSVEPRAAIKWSPVYFMDIKASYSRMSQGDHLVASTYIDLPSNTWMPSTETIRPVTSDQVSGGFYFKPMEGMDLNIEGWYRNMNHLLMYDGPNAMFPPVEKWESHFTEGKGESFGLEGELSWRNDKISVSAYYTLSWSRRFFEEMYPDWFWDHNDNRHKINLVGAFKVTKWLEINANWNYHTGNRITFPSNVLPDGTMVYDEPYNLTLPDYHRLDLGLLFTHETKRGHKLETNVSIYNTYNHKNAFFAYLTTDESGNVKGTAYSVIPIFPSVSMAYKF